jgi:hypothetical protein
MNTKLTLVFTLGLAAAMTAGCVGTGPNTQNGAVLGAAGGALAGAILGHNSGSHSQGNTLAGAAIGAAAGGVAGAAIGNSVDHQNGTVYGQPQARVQTQADQQVVLAQPPAPPPPPPREVVAVRPAQEAIWVEGYYMYSGYGNQYQWVPGHWEVPPPYAHVWVAPGWVRHGHGYVYMRGHWR